MKPAVSASKLFFSYKNTKVLQNAEFQIAHGEFIGVIGPNGGGKTTLLKLIMGFLAPQKGALHVFGKTPLDERRRIGYVPQSNQTDRDFPITVLELVLLGSAKSYFFYPDHLLKKAHALIEELGLGPHKSKSFASLSGGLAQKALLARALLSDPDLLLLDEPTANIDPASRIEIYRKLDALKGQKTILLVTHDLRTIIENVDRILCVQTQITSYLPREVCEHFALGLYHAPLIPMKESDRPERLALIEERSADGFSLSR
jgi:zinc transport system ATP-binding protein